MLLLLWRLVERCLLGGDLQHKRRVEALALAPIVAELVRCQDRLLDLLPVIEVCVPVQPRLPTTVSETRTPERERVNAPRRACPGGAPVRRRSRGCCRLRFYVEPFVASGYYWPVTGCVPDGDVMRKWSHRLLHHLTGGGAYALGPDWQD